mgnify:CR=1 FL=1
MGGPPWPSAGHPGGFTQEGGLLGIAFDQMDRRARCFRQCAGQHHAGKAAPAAEIVNAGQERIAEEILAAFKSVYGEKVLMAPVKAGFNLIGYTVPFIALGMGAVLIAALMRRWKRTPVVTTLPASHIEATEGELAALDAAVKQDR